MASSGIFLAFPSAYLSISAENERLAPRPIYLSLEIPSAFEVPALSPEKKRNPVVAEVGEEVGAVVAREWKQGLARGSGEGGGPVNWTWCCCYLHAALSTGAAELLSSRSSAHLRRMGWGAPELAEHICE